MNRSIPLMAFVLGITTAETHAQGFSEIDIGNVRARFYANGQIGADAVTNAPHFEVPIGSGIHALFSSGLWIGGISADQQLHFTGTLYAGDDMHFQPGPLSLTGTTTPDISAQYDQVVAVRASDIAEHLAYYRCVSDPDCDENVEFPQGHSTPLSFLQWPAEGPGLGYDPYLAPFYDLDENGLYEPEAGDAPCILGDQALFFVYNDATNSSVGHSPIGLEIRAMPFAFAQGTPAIRNTVFVRYHLINRSIQTLTQTRLGLFADFDLGCPNDDFAGTDPARNLFYTYNWDDYDEIGCSGLLGYEEHPPAIGAMMIKGPLLDANGIDDALTSQLPAFNGRGFGNTTMDDERSGLNSTLAWNPNGPNETNDPTTTGDYLKYLRATWKDNTPMAYGGYGYSTAPEALPARFMYPGDSDPLGAGTGGIPQVPWAESVPINPDRRGVMGTDAFTLEPGEHVDIVVAFLYARAEFGTALGSVEALQAAADEVLAFCEEMPLFGGMEGDGFAGQCANHATLGLAEPGHIESLAFFPTPATDLVSVVLPSAAGTGSLVVRDALGRVVHTQRTRPRRNDIDISMLADGVYSAEIIGGTKRYLGRVVKD